MTRDPRQKLHHSKALHARNTTVGHLSKSVKYEPSYSHSSLLSPIKFLKNGKKKFGGKKILNTTFYPDQKGINKFIKGK